MTAYSIVLEVIFIWYISLKRNLLNQLAIEIGPTEYSSTDRILKEKDKSSGTGYYPIL